MASFSLYLDKPQGLELFYKRNKIKNYEKSVAIESSLSNKIQCLPDEYSDSIWFNDKLNILKNDVLKSLSNYKINSE